VPKVGLVLGGGGLVGQAFHAGALAAIEHDHGWDPRHADVIIGTSAGAMTGALLRRGVPASELAAFFVGTRGTLTASLDVEMPAFTPMRPHDMIRPHLPSPRVIGRCLRLPWRRDPLAALMALAPDGAVSLLPHLAILQDLGGDTWPDDALWITATRHDDASRVVFGSAGDDPPSLTLAVAASCAVPGYFCPVEIDGERYLDGGVHSPSNADALAAAAVDLVMVVSPLSTSAPVGYGLGAIVRRVASSRLRREVGTLEAHGHTVVVIEPTADGIDAMGRDLMSAGACGDTVREGFLELGRESGCLAPRLRSAFGPTTRAA
jgi:NTE family protein